MWRVLGLFFMALTLTACQTQAALPHPIASPRPTATTTIAPTMTPLPPLTIVTLGDSLTQGDKDDSPEGGGWLRRLLPLIQQVRPQTQIINLAQPGWTSRDLLQGAGGAPNQIDEAVKILREAGGEKFATVWIGANDLFYLYEFGNPTSAEEDQEAVRFGRDLDELLDRLRDTGAALLVALLHDSSQGLVQSNGVFTSITAEEWARMSQQAQRYNTIIKAAAAKYDATLVDIPTTKIFTTPALMYEDGIHPNARGYDELAKVWFNALAKNRGESSTRPLSLQVRSSAAALHVPAEQQQYHPQQQTGTQPARVGLRLRLEACERERGGGIASIAQQKRRE
jgi:lysophospholipase L1-like esterase